MTPPVARGSLAANWRSSAALVMARSLRINRLSRGGPKIPEKIQWVEPKMVCAVAFAEWTEDEQLLRQTTFLGWRDDENPEEVVI